MNPTVLRQKLLSFAVERYFGICTTGYVSPITEGGVHYTPLPYQIIFRILGHLQMDSDDVFVDIGCGKGRVVCCVCRTSVRRVVALEINPDLLQETLSNVRRLRGARCPVNAVAMLAEDYDYAGATVIYLYNPFHGKVLRKVMAKVDASFKHNPRNLRVVYANCLHEAALEELGWLERYEEWPASEFQGFGCPISFWRSDSFVKKSDSGIYRVEDCQ